MLDDTAGRAGTANRLTQDEFEDRLRAIAHKLGDEVMYDYSGRGMFGAACLGLVASDVKRALEEIQGAGLPKPRVDQLALRHILYWPSRRTRKGWI